MWSGRPAQGVILLSRDVVLVPAGITWSAEVARWLSAAWREGTSLGVFGLGVLAVLPGAWLGLLRLLADRRFRARTLYGITDRKVLEVRLARRGQPRRGHRAEVWSVPIRDIAPVDVTVYGGGRTTIAYGPDVGPERDLRMLPAGSSWWPDSRQRLELIAHGRAVHELLCATGAVPITRLDGAHRPSSRLLQLSRGRRT